MTRVFSWLLSLVAGAVVALLAGVFAWQSVPVWRHAGAGYVTSASARG